MPTIELCQIDNYSKVRFVEPELIEFSYKL